MITLDALAELYEYNAAQDELRCAVGQPEAAAPLGVSGERRH
jgi:hypothetical protein